MKRNAIDYVEIWPDDPEGMIRESCRVWGLPPPREFRAAKREGWGNLALLAILDDGSLYMLEHAPISGSTGPIINRCRTDAELEFMRRYGLMPAAVMLGRKGGEAATKRKAAASRENGKRGGRPPKKI